MASKRYWIETNRGLMWFTTDRDSAEHWFRSLVHDMRLGYSRFVEMWTDGENGKRELVKREAVA